MRVVLVAITGFWICFVCNLVRADEPLAVELGQQEAWTGQPVELYLTIRAPGPFSGQAQFDLPEMAGLYFLAAGSPVVGSETVDGAEYFTQRHKWLVFSQRSGSVTIPAIQARFEARRSYTGESEPFTAVSEPVTYRVQRPPGFADDTIVVTTSSLTGEQAWSPADERNFKTGEAVIRTVTRKVKGSSAMMLAPIETKDLAPAIRATAADPEVRDTIERGNVNGERVDRITYQFLQPGRVEIPPIDNAWWNAETREQQTLNLPGTSLEIAAAPSPPPPPRPWWQIALLTLGIVLGLLLLFLIGQVGWKRWNAWWNRPERVLARRFTEACRRADSKTALASMLAWERLAGFPSGMPPGYREERENLLAIDFATQPPKNWNGARHATEFQQGRARLHQRTAPHKPSLPALNP